MKHYDDALLDQYSKMGTVMRTIELYRKTNITDKQIKAVYAVTKSAIQPAEKKSESIIYTAPKPEVYRLKNKIVLACSISNADYPVVISRRQQNA